LLQLRAEMSWKYVYLLLLLATPYVILDDEKCMLIFDDCKTCISTPGCGWCESGFCLSETDGLLSCTTKLQTSVAYACPLDYRNKRDTTASACSHATDCATCNLLQDCAWCVYKKNTTTTFTTCQSTISPDSSVCPVDSYNSLDVTLGGTCPSTEYSSTRPQQNYTANPVATGKRDLAGTATVEEDAKIALTLEDLCIYFTNGLNTRHQELGVGIRLETTNCNITEWQTVDSSSTPTTPIGANGQFTLVWENVATTDVDQVENTTSYIITNFNPYILPIVIVSPEEQPISGSSPLSSGQIAGIAIGAIVGFFLLLLLLLLVLFALLARRSSSGPFRAPQASFRP